MNVWTQVGEIDSDRCESFVEAEQLGDELDDGIRAVEVVGSGRCYLETVLDAEAHQGYTQVSVLEPEFLEPHEAADELCQSVSTPYRVVHDYTTGQFVLEVEAGEGSQ